MNLRTAAVLALLGVPRVVLHDLHVIEEGGLATVALVIVVAIVWIGTAVATEGDRPFQALLAVGALHGVLLAATHQLLWSAAHEDGRPRLGGELAGELSDGAEELAFRVAATFSSLITGVLMGAVTGAIATAVTRVRRP